MSMVNFTTLLKALPESDKITLHTMSSKYGLLRWPPTSNLVRLPHQNKAI